MGGTDTKNRIRRIRAEIQEIQYALDWENKDESQVMDVLVHNLSPLYACIDHPAVAWIQMYGNNLSLTQQVLRTPCSIRLNSQSALKSIIYEIVIYCNKQLAPKRTKLM